MTEWLTLSLCICRFCIWKVNHDSKLFSGKKFQKFLKSKIWICHLLAELFFFFWQSFLYSIYGYLHCISLEKWGFPGSWYGKESACNVGDRVPSLGWEDPLEKEMATHSSILVFKIPCSEESGGLQCMELQSQIWLRNFTFFSHYIRYYK